MVAISSSPFSAENVPHWMLRCTLRSPDADERRHPGLRADGGHAAVKPERLRRYQRQGRAQRLLTRPAVPVAQAALARVQARYTPVPSWVLSARPDAICYQLHW